MSEFKTEVRWLPACYANKKVSLKKFPRDVNQKGKVEWYCDGFCPKSNTCKLDKKPIKATITYKIEVE